MSELHFAEPGWVHLLWAVAVFVALLLWMERRRDDALGRFVSTALQARLLSGPRRIQHALRIAFLGLAGVFLSLALMRPQWGIEQVSTPRAGAEIMIALDVSRSMLAEDVAPNRLDRAKAEIRDLLGFLDGDQVGLIAFAGRASVLAPLTPDFGFLRLALDHAGPHTVGRGGTRLEEPVRKAIAGFGDVGDVSRSILLITDGEDHDSFPLEAARDAAERGISIIAIGFGDEAGSEITITDRETGSRTVLRDADGQVVRSRLDGALLREMALATGGAYVPAGTGALDLESIYERHLLTLTRGRLDGRTRAVRNDAYQWAVLMALLALLGAVASTARRADPASRGVNVTLSATVMLAGLVLSAMPDAVDAQAPGTESQAPARPSAAAAMEPSALNGAHADPGTDATNKTEPVADTPIPEQAREAYNLGIERLDAGDTEQAARLLRAARERAGNDGEVRFRATYNLGWSEVRAAEATMESEPARALEHLYTAAEWFQEAVRLRGTHEDARSNLELVMRRALALADSLAERDSGDVAEGIEQLITAQRAFLTELRAGLAGQAPNEQPAVSPESRRVFRGLASRQLSVLSDADGLNQRVARELDVLQAKPEEERQPEDRLRAAQLDALLGHLNRARERLAQTRTRLRRLQGERAYRRASNALSALKRARDQIQNPLARLDALLGDGFDISRQTALYSGSGAGAGGLAESAPRPPWLTKEYLAAEQSDLEARTDELHHGLRAGLDGDGRSDAGDENEAAPAPSPERERLLARLREASPLIAEARAAFSAATGSLAVDRATEALAIQRRGLEHLAAARERFLDLRQLIELVFEQETRVRDVLVQATEPRAKQPATTAASSATVAVDELAPRLAPVHERNLQRMARLGTMITDAAIEAGQNQAPPGGGQPVPGMTPQGATPEQQRFERAYELWRPASDAMHTTQLALDALASATPAADTTSEDARVFIEGAADSVDDALRKLADLRRHFFSVLEHLRDTATQQQSLADETEAVAAMDDPGDPAATLRRAGPLAPKQSRLGETAEAVVNGLRQQAQAAIAPSAQTGDSPTAPDAGNNAAIERMNQAADLVGEARTDMSQAASGLQGPPPRLQDARDAQDRALANLLEAIVLLEQPRDQHSEGEQQDGSPEQQHGGAGESEPSPDRSASNMAQLLQGVRDREARRRDELARGRSPDFEPVEKDW